MASDQAVHSSAISQPMPTKQTQRLGVGFQRRDNHAQTSRCELGGGVGGVEIGISPPVNPSILPHRMMSRMGGACGGTHPMDGRPLPTIRHVRRGDVGVVLARRGATKKLVNYF